MEKAYSKHIECGGLKELLKRTTPGPHQSVLRNSVVFFDFDNTITVTDILDTIIEKFAASEAWKVFEEEWQEGTIGSRECLDGQMRLVRVKKAALLGFLKSVKIDPYFKKIYEILKKKKIKTAIVSDSFGFFIDQILRNHGIKGLKIYSNKIKLKKDRLTPSFPHLLKEHPYCANCKKKHLLAVQRKGKKLVYIGDGLSDLCPAQHADLVFAKGTLAKYLKKSQHPFVEFTTLKDVYYHLGDLHDETDRNH